MAAICFFYEHVVGLVFLIFMGDVDIADHLFPLYGKDDSELVGRVYDLLRSPVAVFGVDFDIGFLLQYQKYE